MSTLFNSFSLGLSMPGVLNSKLFQDKINNKTKPIGSLGQLETIALQLAHIQNTVNPEIVKPHMLVFAADHGIAHEGVSAYPQEVTYQMVYNFLSGGAAINVLCNLHSVDLSIIDAGVNHDFQPHPGLINRKVDFGTKSFMTQNAMTVEQVERTMEYGREIASAQIQKGSNVIGFGEMGIANTSAASMICFMLTGIPLPELIGSGTGLTSEGKKHKQIILEKALQTFLENAHMSLEELIPFKNEENLLKIICWFSGFEILMMSAAMLETARNGCTVVIDGFISTAAYLIAQAINPSIRNFCVFSHLSNEKGHQAVLAYLEVEPVLRLSMRLGEGSGAVMAFPVLRSACAIMSQMASFDSAGISKSAG